MSPARLRRTAGPVQGGAAAVGRAAPGPSRARGTEAPRRRFRRAAGAALSSVEKCFVHKEMFHLLSINSRNRVRPEARGLEFS